MPTYEIKRLRSALLILLICSIFSGLFYYQALKFLNTHKMEEQDISTDIHNLEGRKHAHTEKLRIFRDYLSSFNTMQTQGYFSKDSKLDWVEELELAARSLKIPQTKYHIEQRKKTPLPNNHEANTLGFYSTPLNISLSMLHEGGLLAFDKHLSNQNLGVYTYESCKLSRVRDEPSFQKLEIMMSAECKVNIYNFIFNDENVDPMSDAGMGLAMEMPP